MPKETEPGVPPLKSTTANEAASPDVDRGGDSAEGDKPAPRVLPASYNGPAQNANGSSLATSSRAASTSSVLSKQPQRETSTSVLLSGEVIANKSGGGPRLMIDVVPFAQSGRVQPFDGTASLMLLANGDGSQHNLGRWDYSEADVRAATQLIASEPTVRFFIELPADTPVSGATQLWLRLIPRDGGKLLAHAKVDLTRPSVFSSNSNQIWPSEESVVAAGYVAKPGNSSSSPSKSQVAESPLPESPSAESSNAESAGAETPSDIRATTVEGKWAVAAPGKPANLPAEAQDESGAGGWRASSEPIPEAIATNTEVTPAKKAEPAERKVTPKAPAIAEKPAQRPSWTPDRGGDSSSHVAARPTWSATR